MLKDVVVPDMGDFDEIPVIEVLVKEGDEINKEDPILTLESDKATMEVPSPFNGKVKNILLKVGDKVSQGTVILVLDPAKNSKNKSPESVDELKTSNSETNINQIKTIDTVSPKKKTISKESVSSIEINKKSSFHEPGTINPTQQSSVYASPSVRKMSRQLGVNLNDVEGSGTNNRILKEDLEQYVKNKISHPSQNSNNSKINSSLPSWEYLDFSKYGQTEDMTLPRIKQISGSFLHRNWLEIPHITQHADADITNIEKFRKSINNEKNTEIKVTLISFIMKALYYQLKKFPLFNSSINADKNSVTLKKFFNIGFAVATDNGLVVPVVRNIDVKGVLEIAKEISELSSMARNGTLKNESMQGGCMTISSLGGIGGNYFTPIINAPEVCILGLGRAEIKPFWDGEKFEPKLSLPLSLSYDHRVIDGAEGATFITDLCKTLDEFRRTLL
jgi:pyruvate dehydrogenase E2 component (dihydrolipoamide acetyltransferase)